MILFFKIQIQKKDAVLSLTEDREEFERLLIKRSSFKI